MPKAFPYAIIANFDTFPPPKKKSTPKSALLGVD